MAKSVLFRRIVGYLGDKYRPSDDELIQLYCDTHKLYRQMLRELRREGLMVKHTNKHGATNLVKNPLAIEATKTAQVLNTILKSLGLTAAQRKPSGGPGGGDDGDGGEAGDEFDKF